MTRNCVWKNVFGMAATGIMLLASGEAKAQSYGGGLNLMISGNQESGFQFVQTTDTFYNSKGDKIVMAYTAPVGRPASQQAPAQNGYGQGYGQPAARPQAPRQQAPQREEYPDYSEQEESPFEQPYQKTFRKSKEKKEKVVYPKKKIEESTTSDFSEESTQKRKVLIPESTAAGTSPRSTAGKSDGTCLDGVAGAGSSQQEEYEDYDSTRLVRIGDSSPMYNDSYKEKDDHSDDREMTGWEHPVYGFIRTNLLGDAIVIPNIGGEITIGEDWSLGADFYLQWLRNMGKDQFYKTYMLELDARRWLGSRHEARPLTGWHVGPYFQALTYDMENGHKGYQSRAFFWTFALGGELGYNMPLSNHWGIDFSLGLGFLHTKYNVYFPDHNKQYYFDHRQVRNLFGPTRLGVSLNYLIR